MDVICNRQAELREVGGSLFGRKLVDSGCFNIRLSEHDGERLDDQGAQPGDKQQWGYSLIKLLNKRIHYCNIKYTICNFK